MERVLDTGPKNTRIFLFAILYFKGQKQLNMLYKGNNTWTYLIPLSWTSLVVVSASFIPTFTGLCI